MFLEYFFGTRSGNSPESVLPEIATKGKFINRLTRRFLPAAIFLSLSSPADAQLNNCRWLGNYGAGGYYCEGSTGPTISNWQSGAWTTVPAEVGLNFPASQGGLSAYGMTFPPSHVTPIRAYESIQPTVNGSTYTRVEYGPGANSRAMICNTAYSGSIYTTCR